LKHRALSLFILYHSANNKRKFMKSQGAFNKFSQREYYVFFGGEDAGQTFLPFIG